MYVCAAGDGRRSVASARLVSCLQCSEGTFVRYVRTPHPVVISWWWVHSRCAVRRVHAEVLRRNMRAYTQYLCRDARPRSMGCRVCTSQVAASFPADVAIAALALCSSHLARVKYCNLLHRCSCSSEHSGLDFFVPPIYYYVEAVLALTLAAICHAPGETCRAYVRERAIGDRAPSCLRANGVWADGFFFLPLGRPSSAPLSLSGV